MVLFFSWWFLLHSHRQQWVTPLGQSTPSTPYSPPSLGVVPAADAILTVTFGKVNFTLLRLHRLACWAAITYSHMHTYSEILACSLCLSLVLSPWHTHTHLYAEQPWLPSSPSTTLLIGANSLKQIEQRRMCWTAFISFLCHL